MPSDLVVAEKTRAGRPYLHMVTARNLFDIAKAGFARHSRPSVVRHREAIARDPALDVRDVEERLDFLRKENPTSARRVE
jgi:hypothetical protein